MKKHKKKPLKGPGSSLPSEIQSLYTALGTAYGALVTAADDFAVSLGILQECETNLDNDLDALAIAIQNNSGVAAAADDVATSTLAWQGARKTHIANTTTLGGARTDFRDANAALQSALANLN